MARVLLISTYELGRQPFGLASPAAWLRADGFEVSCLDLSQQHFDPELVRCANVIAFYLPMHTATRIGMAAIAKVRKLSPDVPVIAYGLYAPLNAELLRKAGVKAVFGGEFEAQMAGWISGAVGNNNDLDAEKETKISLDRLQFRVPDRSGLPPLEKYARLAMPDDSIRTVGYTEASRGCKHLCRHCPIVPVYGGKFRIVQRDIVLEDIRRQVAAGAEHITFGDPDFFNGVGHALELVTALHQEFPRLSYDVTIKVEHLLKHAMHLPTLRDTGCAFVTTAVESLDDRVLALLEKGHTRADFVRVVSISRDTGLTLAPTFVAFTPWISLQGYADLLRTISELDLVDNVSPVQLAIRLLIPSRSRLLEVAEVQEIIGDFDPVALSYRWQHPDPRVDQLQRDIDKKVQALMAEGHGRRTIFEAILHMVTARISGESPMVTQSPHETPRASRVTVPYLTEPWYC